MSFCVKVTNSLLFYIYLLVEFIKASTNIFSSIKIWITIRHALFVGSNHSQLKRNRLVIFAVGNKTDEQIP